jgi:hypothetical protein
MSYTGDFTIECPDIVRLEANPDNEDSIARVGWVNVGAHSIEIIIDAKGNLTVMAYACANESSVLASFIVGHSTAMAAGATDLDE